MRQVLVTGGTSGIGRAIAEAFASEGCRVIAAGLAADELQGIEALPLDVTQPAQIAELLARLERLDVLVNAAGILLRGGEEFDPENFARVLDVNLTGTMRMCLAARPLLAASRGCIINIASMLSFFGSGHVPAYSASKGGVAQLTKSLAIAWASEGIRVNAIAPGWIDTAMSAPLVADPARRDAIISRTPLGRWGQPADVAGAAMFLASPAAAFITGVILPVDGGYSIA
jgi:NAD(P)-dependent dehydrogenase (short-subunit alcohol dehydrogenase family)